MINNIWDEVVHLDFDKIIRNQAYFLTDKPQNEILQTAKHKSKFKDLYVKVKILGWDFRHNLKSKKVWTL